VLTVLLVSAPGFAQTAPERPFGTLREQAAMQQVWLQINGTIYSHPIGVNGHGAGPLIGLWDYQDHLFLVR
jgi:hypothetical protein